MNKEIISQYSQYEAVLENYASILEKTNQQLSVWSNPYGIMIGILALIFTALTIAVSWYIWRSSKEQKDLFKQTLLGYQEAINNQTRIFLEEKKAEINKTIADFEQIKDSITEEKKAEFQKIINEYQQQRTNIYETPVPVEYSWQSPFLTRFSKENLVKGLNCLNCGAFFKYKDDKDSSVFITDDYLQKKVKCPQCGVENILPKS